VQTTVIASAADLDSWLAGIREKLAGLLKSNKRIRIKGRDEFRQGHKQSAGEERSPRAGVD
jgi:hypothetical protein